jgi:FkbH-like protein
LNALNTIKLVIWDLDNTFWKGTLSEEVVIPSVKCMEIVKELTDRGILNSIASKNELEPVKKLLSELKIWEYFVFPHINWQPKGEAVKNIINKCQLRNENVLFIDDNISNLKEVEFYNQNILTVMPNFIDKILTHKAFVGKNDKEHTRLKQYKILERRDSEKEKGYDNISFLEKSKIRISFISDLNPIRDRIYEMITRTNQLNFTKNRLNQEEVRLLLSNKEYEQRAISALDKFGNYGIVGYYCLDIHKKKLIHFLFSCRILNLGIEQYVYSKLNFPNLDIVPDISVKLDLSSPHWISDVRIKEEREKEEGGRRKVLFKGGCDLGQMLYYIEDKYKLHIVNEINYTGLNNAPIHNDHTQMVLNAVNLSAIDQKIIEALPFFDKNSHKTKLFKNNYDICIYSLLMDYTQSLYEHKEKRFKIPYGGYTENLTDPSQHKEIVNGFLTRKITGVSEEFLNKFSDEYIYHGQETIDQFKENLKEIRKRINNNIPIIFLNGSEVNDDFSPEKGSTIRHINMNKALEEFISNSTNCYLLDIRKYVKGRNDVTDHIRHYQRNIYWDLSTELVNLLQVNGLIENGHVYNLIKSFIKQLYRRTVKYIHRKKRIFFYNRMIR